MRQQQRQKVLLPYLYRLVHACIRKKDLNGSREVFALINQNGLHSESGLASELIRAFTLCRSLSEANQVFAGLPEPDASVWTAVIAAHAKLGHASMAIELYQRMLDANGMPTEHAFASVVKACTSSSTTCEIGKVIHGHIVHFAFESSVYVCSSLIDMYAKHDSLSDAVSVFNHSQEQNVVTYTAMIAGYTQLGHPDKALRLFNYMQHKCVEPNYVTYICIFKACSTVAASDVGRLSHALITEASLELIDDAIVSILIDMYAKCGSCDDSQKMFNLSRSANVVPWSAMITGYAQAGNGWEALQLLKQMLQEGLEPPDVALIGCLQVCCIIQAVDQGIWIHAYIVASNHKLGLSVGNALLDMYTKCGHLERAHIVFKFLLQRDNITWSTMIAGYAEQGESLGALYMFQQMQQDDIEPDKVTFGCVLKACARMNALCLGRLIHVHIIQHICKLEVFLANSLIDMYVKCSSIKDARDIFENLHNRDSVTWSTMIGGYAHTGNIDEAFSLFKQMEQLGLKPNDVTLVSILKAYSSVAPESKGEPINRLPSEGEHEQNLFVVNSFLDLHIKSGRIKEALDVFNRLQERHVVMWSTLISGLTQHDHCQESLDLFQCMQQEGIEADNVMFVCVLKACSKLAALEQGKLVHSQIKQRVCETDSFIGSTLIDMYAKCGSLECAQRVFDSLVNRDVVAWSAIIAGYAENCDYQAALQYFQAMQNEALLEPNEVTFVSLLCACTHTGLINAGCYHFQSMSKDYGITPLWDHYSCMVDLFGRTGYLDEAEDMMITMPFKPNLMAWMSLLSHCRMHGNMSMGHRCFESLVQTDHGHASSYELMSKLYVDAGQLDNAEEVQEERKDARAWKKVGKAFIEVNNNVYNFLVGSKELQQMERGDTVFNKIILHIKIEGYVPLVDSILHSLFCNNQEVLPEHYDKSLL